MDIDKDVVRVDAPGETLIFIRSAAKSWDTLPADKQLIYANYHDAGLEVTVIHPREWPALMAEILRPE